MVFWQDNELAHLDSAKRDRLNQIKEYVISSYIYDGDMLSDYICNRVTVWNHQYAELTKYNKDAQIICEAHRDLFWLLLRLGLKPK